MDGLTNKNNPAPVEEETSELYQRVISAKPLFSSKAEAISNLTQELEALAQKCGISVPALLKRAEYSSVYNEDEDRAADLAQTITALKK